MDKNTLTAAAIGGLLVGILSAIPLFSLGNVCCLLWAWLGSFLAIRLFARATGKPCTAKKALAIGALTGIVGGIVWPITFLGVNMVGASSFAQQFQMTAKQMDFTPFLKNVSPEQAKYVKQQMEDFANLSVRSALFRFTMLFAPLMFMMMLLICTFAGLVGALLFGDDVGSSEAPQPAPGS